MLRMDMRVQLEKLECAWQQAVRVLQILLQELQLHIWIQVRLLQLLAMFQTIFWEKIRFRKLTLQA